MKDLNQPASRRDLIGYSIFVYILGFFSATMIILGAPPWSAIIAIVFIALVVLVGFTVIDDALPPRTGRSQDE